MTTECLTREAAEVEHPWAARAPLGLAVEHATTAVVVGTEAALRAVAVGEAIEIKLHISGLPQQAAPSLGAFEISVHYDPRVLVLQSLAFGDPLAGDLLGPIAGSTTGSAAHPEEGSVSLFGVSLDAAADLHLLQPSSFHLARLGFRAIGTGTTQVTPRVNDLADAEGRSLRILGTRSVTITSRSTFRATPLVSPANLAGGSDLLRQLQKLAAL